MKASAEIIIFFGRYQHVCRRVVRLELNPHSQERSFVSALREDETHNATLLDTA